MNNQVAAARQAIGQILAGLEVATIVCIDDFYFVEKSDDGLAQGIAWSDQALSLGLAGGCCALVDAPSFFDAPDDVWRRRLRERWTGLSEDERSDLLDGLAQLLGIEVSIARDRHSASLLRKVIPEFITLHELPPGKWEREKARILESVGTDSALLCLFDHNLEADSSCAGSNGMVLLEQMVHAQTDTPLICGLLTHTVRVGEEIERGHALAVQHSLKPEDLLVLSKDRLDDPMRFAHGLKMVSLNHARDFLTSRVRKMAGEADKQARDELMKVDVYDFDYMVLRSSRQEGIWEAETLFRLYEILRRVAFRQEALAAANRTALNDKITQIRAIREVQAPDSNQDYPPNQRWKLRRLELYEDGSFVNEAHLPLELGDIFESAGKKYILIAQPCDLMVREAGKRSADSVVLARITLPQDVPGLSQIFNYPLMYFDPSSGKHGAVKLRQTYHISTEVLDLAVFDSTGQCRFGPSTTLPMLHTPWRNRFQEIHRIFEQHETQLDELYSRLTSLSDEAGEYLKNSLGRKLTSSNLAISFSYDQGAFEFDLRRVGRYRQPGATRLLSHYVACFTREAEEHDFALFG